MKLHLYDFTSLFWTPSYSVHRWHNLLNEKPGTYRIVSENTALARMQGADYGDMHPTCVVDDYGQLVKVPA